MSSPTKISPNDPCSLRSIVVCINKQNIESEVRGKFASQDAK